MGSGKGVYSVGEFDLDAKWLVDPKLLFVGPKIGEGAHAKVYEGKYKNQNVAIKMVHRGDSPEEITKREGRFAREVEMLSRVQHKNLVKFIGACMEPAMVIVTELLQGGTLRKYLVNMRPRCLDIRVAIGFALDISRAMECLHSHGIIHRDLKPENLLLTADHKTVKLADFGLAREESLTEMMTAETGTYRWMAPELYSTVTLKQGEKKHYNNKVDAYSFAIVLWELIHNKLPFEGMSNLQAAYAAAFRVGTFVTLLFSFSIFGVCLCLLASFWTMGLFACSFLTFLSQERAKNKGLSLKSESYIYVLLQPGPARSSGLSKTNFVSVTFHPCIV